MRGSLSSVIVSLLILSGSAAAKSGGNAPYVATFESQSPFYARCIPDQDSGSQGTTQIFQVRKEGDEIITTFPWYNRHGLSMGWSPIAGKVAVMRIRQEEGLAPEKQIEFSFYLEDKLLHSYTTADLIQLGAKATLIRTAGVKGFGNPPQRALYQVEGCHQVAGTNDYYFKVRLGDKETLLFDVLSGNLCRVERDGAKQRLVSRKTSSIKNGFR